MWPFSIWKISGHKRLRERRDQREREMIKAGSHQVVGKASQRNLLGNLGRARRLESTSNKVSAPCVSFLYILALLYTHITQDDDDDDHHHHSDVKTDGHHPKTDDPSHLFQPQELNKTKQKQPS